MTNIVKTHLNISILIAVHYEINPSQLKVSIDSIFFQKSIPNQIIIVADGPISLELTKYLSEISTRYEQIIITNLKENKGLAYALNYGIKKTNYELIARLDPDDVVIKDRFLEQQKEFEKDPSLSICGSYVQEISKTKKIRLIKKPLSDNEIKDSLKIKNPIIHSTVMFKKSNILSIGGYPTIYKCQDYLLWIKCMEKNNKFKNVNKALVTTKLDKSLMKRRGIDYFYYEKQIYRYMLEKEIINYYLYYLNTITRFILRSLPYPFKFLLYQIR